VGVVGFAFMFAYALVAVFGVLVVSTERSTGLLAATLAAVQRRTPVLAAKLLVSAVAGIAIGLVGAVASFLLVQPQLGGRRRRTRRPLG
jgi:ABC-2 type transport system permease protein